MVEFFRAEGRRIALQGPSGIAHAEDRSQRRILSGLILKHGNRRIHWSEPLNTSAQSV